MSMKKILEDQLGALKALITLLEEEKELLVTLKEPLLMGIVESKRQLVEQIEALETRRKTEYDDEVVQQYLHHHVEGKRLLATIEQAVRRVRELQETNLMLTTQSIVYNNNLLQLIQESVVKAPAIYSGQGHIQTRRMGVQAAFDQSV